MSYGPRSVRKRGGRYKNNYSENTMRRTMNNHEIVGNNHQSNRVKAELLPEPARSITNMAALYDDPKTLYIFCKYYGSDIKIITDKEEFNGVLKSISPNGDFCLMEVTIYRRNAEHINRSEKFTVVPVKDVKVFKVNNDNVIDFQQTFTDAEISNRNRALRDINSSESNRANTDVALTPFYETLTLSDDCLSLSKVGAHWFPPEEMFEKNKINFNVKSTFSEDLKGYTTQLHKDDPNYKKEVVIAQKKADEIERTRDRKLDSLENTDHDTPTNCYGGRSYGHKENEELTYCSVVRSNNKHKDSPNKRNYPTSNKVHQNHTSKTYHHNSYNNRNYQRNPTKPAQNTRVSTQNTSKCVTAATTENSMSDKRLNPNAVEFTPTTTTAVNASSQLSDSVVSNNSVSSSFATSVQPTHLPMPPPGHITITQPAYLNPQQYNDMIHNINLQFTNLSIAPGPPPNSVQQGHPAFIPAIFTSSFPSMPAPHFIPGNMASPSYIAGPPPLMLQQQIPMDPQHQQILMSQHTRPPLNSGFTSQQSQPNTGQPQQLQLPPPPPPPQQLQLPPPPPQQQQPGPPSQQQQPPPPPQQQLQLPPPPPPPQQQQPGPPSQQQPPPPAPQQQQQPPPQLPPTQIAPQQLPPPQQPINLQSQILPPFFFQPSFFQGMPLQNSAPMPPPQCFPPPNMFQHTLAPPPPPHGQHMIYPQYVSQAHQNAFIPTSSSQQNILQNGATNFTDNSSLERTDNASNNNKEENEQGKGENVSTDDENQVGSPPSSVDIKENNSSDQDNQPNPQQFEGSYVQQLPPQQPIYYQGIQQKMFHGPPPPQPFFMARPSFVYPQQNGQNVPTGLNVQNTNSNTSCSINTNTTLPYQPIGNPAQFSRPPQQFITQMKPVPTPNNFNPSLNQSFIPPPHYQYIQHMPQANNKYPPPNAYQVINQNGNISNVPQQFAFINNSVNPVPPNVCVDYQQQPQQFTHNTTMPNNNQRNYANNYENDQSNAPSQNNSSN